MEDGVKVAIADNKDSTRLDPHFLGWKVLKFVDMYLFSLGNYFLNLKNFEIRKFWGSKIFGGRVGCPRLRSTDSTPPICDTRVQRFQLGWAQCCHFTDNSLNAVIISSRLWLTDRCPFFWDLRINFLNPKFLGPKNLFDTKISLTKFLDYTFKNKNCLTTN